MSRERVLVIPAAALEPYLPKFKGGVLEDAEALAELREVISLQGHYVDREAAETDESVKQVIPYCVLTRSFLGEAMFFNYSRTKKGGEKRLHEKRSLGVGGHINPGDGTGDEDFYDVALRRELREEVGLTVSGPQAPRAVIYDPSDEVGRVHLGLVHLVTVPDGWTPQTEDPALAHGFFTFANTLRDMADRGMFENWSRMVYHKLLAA